MRQFAGLYEGSEVALETRLDAVTAWVDIPTMLMIGGGTLRKMRQNLGWAVGYNAIAIPIAAGVSLVGALGSPVRPPSHWPMEVLRKCDALLAA